MLCPGLGCSFIIIYLAGSAEMVHPQADLQSKSDPLLLPPIVPIFSFKCLAKFIGACTNDPMVHAPMQNLQ